MNILIADDHHLILEGLGNILRELRNARVYEAKNKMHLMHHLREDRIDILFQDILFGNHDARNFLMEIKDKFPDLKIIIISSISELEVIESLLKQGVNGYLLKSDDLKQILEAIDVVMENEIYISSDIQEMYMGKTQIEQRSSINLTPREKEVLDLILKEKTIKEIADKLIISSKTVEKHRANLFIKFQARNIAGLVKKAVLEGYY